jgi:hypothetical protein
MPGKIPLLLIWLLGLAPLKVWARTIDVLWYTYAHPGSTYVQTVQKLSDVVHTLPQAGGIRWRLTFFRPGSPPLVFGRYHVLVIHSGEAFQTGQKSSASGPDAEERNASPDYSGILKNKTAIEAARGDRTFITGADADVHMISGDSGNAPVDSGGQRLACNPPITGRSCWDGALGHLVNAVNWAGNGSGLGIVSLVAGEFPGSEWWLHRDSFLRAELFGHVTIWGPGHRENEPAIPVAAQSHPLNAGLTSKGLSHWNHSFHGGISQSIPGYVPIVNSTRYANTAVAIATDKSAVTGSVGSGRLPESKTQPPH